MKAGARLALAVAAILPAVFVAAAAPQVRDAAPAPAATLGTAQISGVVTSADQTPVPLRRVTVTLSSSVTGLRLMAVTDDAGGFTFAGLPADRYTLSAAKSAYLPASYGSTRAGGAGTPIALGAGQRTTVAMRLVRGGVLSGTVRDDLGRPVPDVTVSVQRFATSAQTGEQTLDGVRIGSSQQSASGFSADAFPGTGVTDDRGVYRIWGLPAGTYFVLAAVRPPYSVSPSTTTDIHQVGAADIQRAQQLLRAPGGVAGATNASMAVATGGAGASRVDYAPVFHPAAIAVADAAPVTLGPSEERFGVDVLLRLVPTAVVSGVATAPDGSPVVGAQISIMDPLMATRAHRTTRSDADGAFVIRGVNPGRYDMQGSSYADGYFGRTDVTVDGRDVEASFVLGPGMTITGRIVFDGATAAPRSEGPLFLVQRVPRLLLASPRYDFAPDGRFTVSNVQPGQYRIRINGRPPAGWMLRSVDVNGADASDIAFEVRPGENIDGVVATLTDRRTEITGTLLDASGRPAPEYVLLVFAADPKFHVPGTRRTQLVRPDETGRFLAQDLPAGEYFISVVTDVEDGQWHDPRFLAELTASGPVKISLAEGEKKVQDLRVERPRESFSSKK